jgi:hypothetical protein
MSQLRSQAEEKERLLHEQTIRCSRLMQLSSIEERRLCSSPFEERGVGDGTDGDPDSVSVTSSAKEMLLHQGAQLSSSAVALDNLYMKISSLHKVISDSTKPASESVMMIDLLKKLVGPEEFVKIMKSKDGKSKRQPIIKPPLLFDDEDPLDEEVNGHPAVANSNMLESVIEEDEEEEAGDVTTPEGKA